MKSNIVICAAILAALLVGAAVGGPANAGDVTPEGLLDVLGEDDQEDLAIEPASAPAASLQAESVRVDTGGGRDEISGPLSGSVMRYAGDIFSEYEWGGPARMQEVEMECWRNASLRNMEVAGRCAIYALAGAFIEAGYAKAQGRMPVPFYQGASAAARVKENPGLPDPEASELVIWTVSQTEVVLIGLANAGMR